MLYSTYTYLMARVRRLLPDAPIECVPGVTSFSAAAAYLQEALAEGAEKLAIVLGTEGDGLAAATIARCDYTACIPMSHGVDSLNVAAASAVAFWQLRQH